RGWKDGRLVSRVRRETAGPAARIELTADRVRLSADGEDVAMITARALDARGRPAPLADDRVVFEIDGPARVIGVGNGNPVSHEPDRASSRQLFNGLAQAVVQTERRPGPIRLAARAEGLRPATLELESGGRFRTTRQ
ncbi:MAG: beta-galactosidase, partial [Alphaproteobacteria bacterium]|nr:beta-galactosidase [Alphaproteobacteria bacterium]